MAQFKYCWEFLIIHFFSLVSFSGSHLFSTSAILVSLTDLHDFPQLFILSGCSPLSNLFHIYHFHILLVSLPSYLQYLELSARPSFPRCPQFSPFHASLGVGTWGQGMPVLCWCEQLCAAFPGWLQVSWHSELCSPGWACMQVTEEVSPLLSSLACWKFSQYLVFLNPLFSVKVEVQLMNSRGVLEARWWGKTTVCSCEPRFHMKSG